MEERGWSTTQLSIQCDLTPRRMGDILSGRATGITFSTFVTICERLKIQYADVFDLDGNDYADNVIPTYIITNGEKQFRICRI